MRILLKFADSFNFKRVWKQLLSLAVRPEKPLVKTRPHYLSSFNMQIRNTLVAVVTWAL